MADCIYCDLKEMLQEMATSAADDEPLLEQIKFRQLVLEEMGKLRFDLIYPLIEDYIVTRLESQAQAPEAFEYELDMRGEKATLIKLNEGSGQ